MANGIRRDFLSALTALCFCLPFVLFGDSFSPSPAAAWTEPERSQPMANAVRVENVSSADQELAPGSGFIPARGHVDYPIEIFREKHERYARARLDADPPVLKLTEFDSPDITARAAELEKQRLDEERKLDEHRRAEEERKTKADEERLLEEQRKAEEASRQQHGEGERKRR